MMIILYFETEAHEFEGIDYGVTTYLEVVSAKWVSYNVQPGSPRLEQLMTSVPI